MSEKISMRKDDPPMMYKVYEEILKTHGQAGITFLNEKGERRRLTYYEIGWKAFFRMEKLKEEGIQPHDFVLFQMYSELDFVINFWACMFGGFVPVLLNPTIGFRKDSQEAEVLSYVFHHLDEPRILVSREGEEEFRPFVGKIGIETEKLIFTGDTDREIPENQNPVPQTNFLTPDDPCMVFFTSGTTGMPKCVLQTNRAAVLREKAVAQMNHFKEDVTLNWMPLEHAGGVLMAHFRALLQGGEQVQVEKSYILEDPIRWLDLLDEFRVSYSWAPHFAYVLINKAIEAGRTGSWDLSCVTFLLDGGEMVDAASAKEFLRRLAPWQLRSDVLHPSWGMCETCSGVLYNNCFYLEPHSGVQEYEGRTLTEIGEPIPGVDIRIVNEKNEVLPEGEIGIFQVKGAPVTLGYYRHNEANAEAFTEDCWFNTGDRGFQKNNRITLTGREKDVVVIHGLNYSNAEIESVIDTLEVVCHSFVAVCQCMSLDGTEEVVAFFTPVAHTEPLYAVEQVMKHVQRTLHMELTRAIPVPKEEIAKSNLGKIQRSKISKKYTAGYFEPIKKLLEKKRKQMEKVSIPEWCYQECLAEDNLKSISSKSEKEEKAVRLMIHHVDLQKVLQKKLQISDQSENIVFQGSFEELRTLGQRIASGKEPCRNLYVLTERMYRTKKDVSAGSTEGEIAGYIKCLAAECENLACVNIDLEDFKEEQSQKLAAEEILSSEVSSFTVLLRSGKRYVMKLEPMVVGKKEAGFTWAGLYLITGGLGGIGLILCKYLLENYQARILVIGRNRLCENSKAEARFQELREISKDVYYESLDVADIDGMENAISKYEKKYHCSLCEIIHTAGIGNLQEHWQERERRMIAVCEDFLYQQMLHAKKTGTQSLYMLAERRENVRLLLFGSTNGFFGTASFSAYSAANSFPSIFAFSKRDSKTDVRCMNFSTWKDIGMSQGNDFGNVGINKGFCEIEAKEGILSIEQCLKAAEPSVYLGLDKRKTYVQKYLHHVATAKEKEKPKISGMLDEMDCRLAGIWEKILHTPVTDYANDFFELGGDSIKAFALPKAIAEEFQVSYTLKEIFSGSRFDEMKARIQEKKESCQ